ncbi:hypothetical protein A3A21_03165 [Candidatus Jorgensenbacteria bacterium RIFCSPLOWO2_01_FULL_45_25b]|uniref:DUF5673 domain-containing protein n=1 Tax=Candidatus Jorgensenbacteria bacterium RIFCSPLOWO2_01_FULL_45_25b TaxID=1798471 RepID=A0A1F6BTZ3_9BACT|nr:MAG: hypothetical protein A3A21_03165 [Candidatus Jorgensenbacteria bacterium RIFCSPLOWO2_01_FULL_45_25b]
MDNAFEWDTTEYEHRERNREWFWAMGILAGAVALTAVFFDNILLAIVILVGVFTLMLLSSRPPQIIRVGVSSRGIRIKNDLYPYSSLKTFWIDEDAPEPTLTVPTGKFLVPHIRVNLEGVDPLALQKYLLRYLREEYQEPTLSEILVHYLGF